MTNPVEAAAAKQPKLFGKRPRGMSAREWNRLRVKAIQEEEGNVYTTNATPSVHLSEPTGTITNAGRIARTHKDYNG